MRTTKLPILPLLAAMLAIANVYSAHAATYYVDFSAGDDSSAGTSESSAWKHAPGDPQAEGNVASATLGAGDVVQFRGGVVYRGGIKVPASGDEGNRLTYRGTGWGEGKGVIDGSDLITGWKKCQSASEAGGNLQFDNLYYADIQSDTPFLLNLHELDAKTSQDEYLHVSQDPNPKDPFFHDRTDSFYPVINENLTTNSITSPDVFNQPDADHWKDSYVLLWTNPNFTKRFKILDYDPAQHQITIEDIGKGAIYPDKRAQSFAIFNSPHAIDKPGEYFVSEADAQGNRRIILWPRSSENLDQRISRSTRVNGFDLKTRSHVEIDGFEIRKFSGESTDSGSAISVNNLGLQGVENAGDLLIHNNLITHNMSANRGYGGIFLTKVKNVIVENNDITWNKGHRGILANDVEDVIVRNNRISYTGTTALSVNRSRRVQLLNNEISHILATHANAITTYIACENILIAGNRVTDATNAITFQDSGPLYYINNFTDGGDNFKNVNEWPNTKRGPWTVGKIVFLNNTFVHAEKDGSLNLGQDPEKNYVIINNILDGLIINSKKGASVKHEHNLYTNPQNTLPDWQAGEGEGDSVSPATLFIDAAKRDFRLAPNGAAIGKGVDVREYYPKDVFPDVDFDTLAGVTKPMNIGATIKPLADH